MVKVNLKVRKEPIIVDNGNTIKCMVKVFIIIIMDVNMKVLLININYHKGSWEKDMPNG